MLGGRRLGAAFAASCLMHVGVLALLAERIVPEAVSRPANARALWVELPRSSLPDQAGMLLLQLSTRLSLMPIGEEADNGISDSPAPEERSRLAIATDFADQLVQRIRFYPNRLLDRRAVPISAPNPREFLTGTSIPAVPFRLRLYVDEVGKVVRVEVRKPIVIDESRLQAVKDMFLATLFIPGHLKGRDVPAYLDIEIELEDVAQFSWPEEPSSPAPDAPRR
jgi:hypothetical protein